MSTVQLIILFSLLTAVVCTWKKFRPAIPAKILTVIHLLSLVLTVSVVILLFNNFRLAGTFSNTAVAVIFIVSGILLFGITNSKVLKIYTGIIFGVNALFQIALFFAPNGLLLFYAIVCYLFQPPYMTKDLAPGKKIEFYDPFLGPPPIYLTEEKYGIFKSQKPMVFKKGQNYYNPQISFEPPAADSAIACCIFITPGSCTKDTLVIRQ